MSKYSWNRNNKFYRERLEKALNERLYLISEELKENIIEFSVMGSKCNVYTITLKQNNTKMNNCSCPDFTLNRNYCKHCLFLEKKVLKGKDLWKKALERLEKAKKEIGIDAPEEIIQEFKKRKLELENNSKEEIDSKATEAENKKEEMRSIEGQDCPICFETLTKGELVWCINSCKNAVHSDCFEKWKKMKHNTCVYCRATIGNVSIQNKKFKLNQNKNEKYINLSNVVDD